MLVEKRQRYFRRYVLSWRGRAKAAPQLPLFVTSGPYSIIAALRAAMAANRATAMDGTDSIDLIKVEHLSSKDTVVLLFHRTSPNATDPAYRKMIDDMVQVRQTAKEDDEDQVMSCHLVIDTKKLAGGGYAAALEEIPGLSATIVLSIVKKILNEFNYPYTEKKISKVTGTYFKAEGVKTESLTDTLKKNGSLEYLVLSQTVPSGIPDSAGIAEPQSQKIKYRIVGDPTSENWKEKFNNFVKGVQGTWDHVSVEIKLEDDRHRTVKLDRLSEAAEILFVRSELAYFDRDIPPCSMNVVTRIVDAAINLMREH